MLKKKTMICKKCGTELPTANIHLFKTLKIEDFEFQCAHCNTYYIPTKKSFDEYKTLFGLVSVFTGFVSLFFVSSTIAVIESGTYRNSSISLIITGIIVAFIINRVQIVLANKILDNVRSPRNNMKKRKKDSNL